MKHWPRRRAYYDTSNFLAPYDTGYFQRGDLFGLGSSSTDPPERLSLVAPPPRNTEPMVPRSSLVRCQEYQKRKQVIMIGALITIPVAFLVGGGAGILIGRASR